MQKVFVIAYVWPEPTASAAGTRMMQLLRFFREQDMEVWLGTPAQRPPEGAALERMGVKTCSIQANDDGFREVITDIAPDIVVFDRYMMEEQFGWRVAEACPDAIRILDTEDLHCLRKYREQCLKKNHPFSAEDLALQPLAKRELAAIYRSDLTLVISEAEMEILKTVFHVPDFMLCYHPLFAEDSRVAALQNTPTFDQRRDMMFIGNYLHQPNRDAMKWLQDELWPEISGALPGVNLHIYGAYIPDSFIQSAKRQPNFIVHGRAESVAPVMQQARLCLAPLRFGAGLKGKLIQAMEFGLPAVTTTTGAEGLYGAMPVPGIIANDKAGLVKAALSLYTDRTAWERSVENGYDIVRQRFVRSPFENKLRSRLNAVSLDLKKHRSDNFTGQMLMDQRNMAARYLSKYIVEKNR